MLAVESKNKKNHGMFTERTKSSRRNDRRRALTRISHVCAHGDGLGVSRVFHDALPTRE